MGSIIDEDGIWGYDPVTDKMTRIGDAPRKGGYSSGGTSFDPWSYEGIKYELQRATGGLDDRYISSNNLSGRINSIPDPNQRNELRSLLDSRRAEYMRNRMEQEKRFAMDDAEEHKMLVQKYKSAWKRRNPIWRVFHQKLNPKNQHFDLYTADTIRDDIGRISKR